MIALKINTKRAEGMLDGYKATLPEGAALGVKRLTQFAVKTYLDYSYVAPAVPATAYTLPGIRPWTGYFHGMMIQQMMEPRRVSKYSYYVAIPHYIHKLDRMRPHVVALKRGRMITRWAREHLGLEGRLMSHITVHPHPFINRADRTIVRNAKRIVLSEMHKKVKRKGK